MGAQNGPIDGPSMGHRWAMAKRSADHRWAIDGNAMVHRWPMDGLPWDPNSGRTTLLIFLNTGRYVLPEECRRIHNAIEALY